ncbi:6-phosphofructokinase [Candidatus Dependentiae bacterium]|nr:6-phosphofructokinase [Candidatus Dependentiae bacterium]
MSEKKIIGILTGGGDAPGLNAVIRGIVYAGKQKGYKIYGFYEGWRGILDKNYEELNIKKVEGIHTRGGTILGSSRTNIYKRENGPETVKKNFKDLGLHALIAVGGEDTLGVANKLFKGGLNVVGVPKTIDNDVNATDYTFGFDTAINRVAETLSWLHTTTESHRRVMVVEVMGRHAGWITLHGGLAGGAHFILIPEEPFDTDELCKKILKRHKNHNYTIVAVAEGAEDPGLRRHIMHAAETDDFGHVQLGTGIGICEVLKNEIEDRTKLETRHLVLGHLQRGGRPSAFDIVLGTRYGVRVIDLIDEGGFGKMVALRESKIKFVELEEGVGELKTVPKKEYDLAKLFFG